MTPLVGRLDESFYPDIQDNWDDSLFRQEILRHLQQDSVILDLGAGAGIVEQMNFKDIVAKVCGVDPDPRVTDNPYVHEGRVGTGDKIPYADAVFDVVFADNVLEHLEDPEAVFFEIARVLKPGGVFLFKTPNRAHYMPLIARFTPHAFHAFINRIRGRATADTFPTRYRANCRREVSRLSRMVGLHVEQMRLVEGRPEYMRIAAPLYLLGIIYERIVNSAEFFSGMRILLVGTLSKPVR